jgi:hypothetical protein
MISELSPFIASLTKSDGDAATAGNAENNPPINIQSDLRKVTSVDYDAAARDARTSFRE